MVIRPSVKGRRRRELAGARWAPGGETRSELPVSPGGWIMASCGCPGVLGLAALRKDWKTLRNRIPLPPWTLPVLSFGSVLKYDAIRSQCGALATLCA